MDNTTVLALLSDSEKFANSKALVSEILRDGFLQLALARKGGGKYTIDECRNDISANCFLNDDKDCLTLDIDDSSSSAILFGLPHRNIRLAQARFVAALQELIIQANISRKLESTLALDPSSKIV